MACFHPLCASVIGYNPDTGKKILDFSPDFSGKYEQLLLPCGHCIGCRLQRSRDWANRCMLEGEHSTSMYFITLTYNDEHLPLVDNNFSDSGEFSPHGTLYLRDLQLFFKRLRKSYPDSHIRFFACGEYGDITHRPHYHAILFNYMCPDLQPFGCNELGQKYYTSDDLSSYWKTGKNDVFGRLYNSPLGFTSIAPANWETCAYVARYVTKKLNGQLSDVYSLAGVSPPFGVMSRRPGIGMAYLDDNKESILKYRQIILRGDERGLKFSPPKAFFKKLSEEYPELVEEINSHNKMLAEFNIQNIEASGLSYESYLRNAENNLEKKVECLRREF